MTINITATNILKSEAIVVHKDTQNRLQSHRVLVPFDAGR